MDTRQHSDREDAPDTSGPIETEEQLDERLTRPSPALIEYIRTLESPLVVLGAGGKMGPTLCVRAVRAAQAANHPLEVVAVSRFSDAAAQRWLDERGVRTIAADLIEPESLRAVPDAGTVFYLVGVKFGTQDNPARTWAYNTLIPAYVARRYPKSRIVALSTGNVYPLVPVDSGGSVETDPLTPLGEYANAAVARERIFTYFSNRNDTPLVTIRLNYATELRYGVLVDLARKVHEGRPVDLTMGYLNCIWQGDANDMILRAPELADSPYVALNLTGPQVLSIRAVAERLGDLLRRPVHFTGHESDTALLNNASKAFMLLGRPPTSIDTILRWTAHWVRRGNTVWDKPTKFEIRDGSY